MSPDYQSLRQKVAIWLAKRGEDYKNNLQLVVIGAGVFFAGAGLLVWADKSISSSVEQELIALAAVILCFSGCITALIGYLGLSIFRLIKFFRDD